MIEVKMIEDSVSSMGHRISTMQLTYPRMIHSEFMTHRVFSRNAGSSRAIPVNRMLKQVRDLRAEPSHWGANQRGMQAEFELDGFSLWAVKALWGAHRNYSVLTAWLMDKLGAHKQVVNRITETHSHIRVVVTSTSWANFLHLRDHEAADPTIRELAAAIKYELEVCTPTLLQPGEWHLPYVRQQEKDSLDIVDLLIMSTARCARVSYQTFEDGQKASNKAKDKDLYQRLVGAQPLHASPAEHQARPDNAYAERPMWGNFEGWVQHRKMLYGEYVKDEPYKGPHHREHVAPAPVVTIQEEGQDPNILYDSQGEKIHPADLEPGHIYRFGSNNGRVTVDQIAAKRREDWGVPVLDAYARRKAEDEGK